MKLSRNKTVTKPTTAETKAQKTVSNLPFFSEEDPDGSYTGVPKDVTQTPIQDVDDL